MQPAPAITTKGHCRHCGGTLILTDEDGRRYCLLCGRPYRDWQNYGRIGGLQTFLRHGSSHMAAIGKKGGKMGGRPRLRLLAPEAQSNRNGGNRLPNRLSKLKELYAAKCKREASLRGN